MLASHSTRQGCYIILLESWMKKDLVNGVAILMNGRYTLYKSIYSVTYCFHE